MEEIHNTVIIVDDNVDILNGIKILLVNNGFKVHAFTNALDALDRIKNHEVNPDIIISDIVMPEMNGYVFFKALSNDPDFYMVPFIFLSGKKTVDDVRFGKTLGVDDYITKPFEPEDLLASVKGKLNRKKSISTLYDAQLKESLKNKELDSGEELFIIFVKWDDKLGPVVGSHYPVTFQEPFSIDEIGLQLFNAASSMFGGSFDVEPDGLLLPLANIKKNAYIYFGSFPAPGSRSRHMLYMVGTIAPRISYMDSLSLKLVFAAVSQKINRRETWNIEALHAEVLAAINGNK